MNDKRIVRIVKLVQMLQGGRGQNTDGLAKVSGGRAEDDFSRFENSQNG
jgi:hypothetical protein